MADQRPSLTPALHRLDRALLAAHVRQVTEREDQLQREWARELTPILDDLYWEPVYSLGDAPEEDDALEAWLLLLLLGGFAHRRLVGNLDSYLRWGADTGGALGLELMGVGGGFHLTNEQLLARLTDRRDLLTAGNTALSLIDTTATQLRRVIQQARGAAESIPGALARHIPAWVQQRVQAISISELTWVVASAQGWVYGRNGIAEQMFITREDRAVCRICAPNHGVVVRVDDVPAHLRLPLHVGCILPGNEVVVPGFVKAATKSLYSGPVIEITFGDGRKLTVTENHPILSVSGWMPAKMLMEGDSVLGSHEVERISHGVNPNHQHAPTPIEEVFRALKMVSPVASMRVPVSAEQFHGDARFIQGEVEVVYANRFLSGEANATIFEPLGESPFVPVKPPGLLAGLRLLHPLQPRGFAPFCGCMSRSHLASALLGRHSLPLNGFGLGLPAQGDASVNQAFCESHTRKSDGLRELVDGFTGHIAGDDIIKIRDAEHLEPANIGTVNVDARSLQAARDSLLANAPLASEFVDRFPGLIAAEKIVQVRKFDFRGHVYDLHVDPYALYFTQGIITHNCRCMWGPVTQDWEPPETIWRGE